jgi:hypothetical protein
MTLKHLGATAVMSPSLQKEVEAQLLADLTHYGVVEQGLQIDWSTSCQEGHCTQAMDGNLEELSSVVVQNIRSEVVAEGWMDFVHGGGTNPLFVFWLFLSILREGEWVKVKRDPTIPEHVWATLPAATRSLCASASEYDIRWFEDPKVQQWVHKT